MNKRIRSDVKKGELVVKRKGWFVPLRKSHADEIFGKPVGYLEGDFFHMIGFIFGEANDTR